MTTAVDVIIIGAGIIGLAIGRTLAQTGREVVVLEKNDAIGEETSSRNSEVIHAGIYYPPGSLKATLCVRGRDALYRYSAEKGIPHRRCGKIIVAVTSEQRAELQLLRSRAAANGARDLSWLPSRQLRALEPAVSGIAGLLSPSTGILDSHALMLALREDLEQAGGQVALQSEFIEGAVEGRCVRLLVSAQGAQTDLRARYVINAAGLHAERVAHLIANRSDAVPIPRLRFAKGNYFIHEGESPFHHLLYPLPEPGGLGVHATLDLSGRLRFGPDVEWTETLDYRLNPERAGQFYKAIRRYWPNLLDGALSPGNVGIRPKLSGPGEPAADFAFAFDRAAGGAVLVHLFGIESPGLTASLAIAEHLQALIA